MEDTTGVSIIVCCYNSARRLPKTVEHLARQHVPTHIPWEVIIVNNASTDDTAEVAEREWKQYQLNIPFIIVEQPKAGLSYARDKGFEIAKYDYCLFCDDDNWLDKDYTRIAFETMESDTTIGVLGGHGEAICEIEPPKWFEVYKNAYAVGVQSDINGELVDAGYNVYGAGATFRKFIYKLLKEKGFRSLLTDRKGTNLSSGGDTELCFSYVLSGYKVYFSNRLKFYHFIEESRLTKKYLRKLDKGNKSARVVLSLYEHKIKQPEILNRNFLWIREICYSAINEIKLKEDIRYLYTLILLKNYKAYHKALNTLARDYK